MDPASRVGSWLDGGAAHFRVWAPDHARIEIVLYSDGVDSKEQRAIPARPAGGGWFEASAPGLGAGALYKIRVDGDGPFPDPCSRSQPLGVHGPSEIVDPSFAWTDAAWTGVALEDLVLYEVHVGAATAEGTFDALIGRLAEIRSLGATAIEIMPVASFPGRWGWGYDGVALFAPAAIYGGPEGLRRLVDAAHAAGLAVILDCVYNHLGPDGNYLRSFARRYFTHRHKTPWGDALGFDGEGAEPVRAFFLANVEMWIREYHLDGLRLDATHAILDDSQRHILGEIAESARAAAPGRRVLVIAEDDRNDARLVLPAREGGLGLDAVWADDFHHQMRVAFAGDGDSYFRDYSGSVEDIAATIQKGWFYEGQVSAHAGRPRGTPARGVDPPRFVHCLQNHDQVGNRALGDRLGARVSPAAYRAMSALLLLGPYTPLLFMGQEWNARSPFQYFTDHGEPLGRQVTEGRRREHGGFAAFSGEEVPDPQDPATFARSKLDWKERLLPEHSGVLAWYRWLLELRASHPALRRRGRGDFSAEAIDGNVIRLDRRGDGASIVVLVGLRGSVDVDLGQTGLRALAFSEEPRFGGAAADPPLHGNRARFQAPAALVLG